MVRGNEYRAPRDVTDDDVIRLSNLFTSAYDPPMPRDKDVALGILARHAYEQFLYQESEAEELARSWALLNDVPTRCVPIDGRVRQERLPDPRCGRRSRRHPAQKDAPSRRGKVSAGVQRVFCFCRLGDSSRRDATQRCHLLEHQSLHTDLDQAAAAAPAELSDQHNQFVSEVEALLEG